jgi:hypothetical protein
MPDLSEAHNCGSTSTSRAETFPLPSSPSSGESYFTTSAHEVLSSTWVMWKDSANPRGMTKEQFEDRIVPSAKITSMGSFLSIWNEIRTTPGQYMPNQTFNLRLFKDGFKPTWEDSARAGKFVIMIDKARVMDAFFTVSMALVSGSYFVHDYAMTGAVVSSRSRAKDAVSIWSNVELASADVETVKLQLQELLGSGVMTVEFLEINGRIAMNNTERLKLSKGVPAPRGGCSAKSSRQHCAKACHLPLPPPS